MLETFNKHELAQYLIDSDLIKTGNFLLSSGKKSNFYYDLKDILMTDQRLLGRLTYWMLHDYILKYFPGTKSIGGMESASIPITTAILFNASYAALGYFMTGFYVRKGIKEHGLQKMIEGTIQEPCVIVDDVLTTGSSIYKAIIEIENIDHKVSGVVTIIDREDPASEKLKKYVRCYSLLKHSDFKLNNTLD